MALLFVFTMFSSPHHPSLLVSEAMPRKGGQKTPLGLPATGTDPGHFLTCTSGILVSLFTPCLTPSSVLYWLTWVYGILLMTMSAQEVTFAALTSTCL